MKPHEIRDKTLEEVQDDIKAARENLRNLKFQIVASQLEKSSMIKQTKREIARLKTIIREHELGIREFSVSNTADEIPPVSPLIKGGNAKTGGEEE